MFLTSKLPNAPWLRRAADVGGVFNATLCLLHCAAGPAALALWGTQEESWDWAFLGLSGALVLGATRHLSSNSLRLALWGFFGVLILTVLLADRYPLLQTVQYAASLGLVGTHLLNLRHCRRRSTMQDKVLAN